MISKQTLQQIFRPARLGVALALCGVCAAAVAADNIAVVNGTPITAEQADALTQNLIQRGQKNTPQLQEMVRNGLIDRTLLSQEAAKEGIADIPEVKAEIAQAQQEVVLRNLTEHYLNQHPIDDAMVRAAYQQMAQQAAGLQEYHLQHILLDNQAQAQTLIAKLQHGGNFDALAKQFSKDAGSAVHGGDLGWVDLNKSRLPGFAEAVQKLKPGQVTAAPVHSQFGWDVIRLDETRPLQAPSFAEIEQPLRDKLKQQEIGQWLASLRAQAKIQ